MQHKMPKAHAYIRVSSKGQVGGISPEAQMHAAMEYRKNTLPEVPWCEDHYGCSVPGFFSDMAVSGWSKKYSWIRNRPAGSAMMDSLQPGDHVIFYSIDRAFRNVTRFGMFLEWCLENNICCHFIVNQIDLATPTGRMRAQMYAVMAEYYSSILSQRIREACLMREKRKVTKPAKKSPKWESSDVRPWKKPKKEVEKVSGRIWLYGRVSDKSQVDSGLGLRYQARDLDRFAEKLQKENSLLEKLDVMLDKGVSAFSTKFRQRPIGRQIFEQAKKGDHIVALRFDRIFRSVKDMQQTIDELTDRGVTLHLIDDGVRTDVPESKLSMNILVSVSQMESDLKSIRQHEINDRLRDKGRPLNQEIPKGCKVVSRRGKNVLVPNKEELVDIYSAFILTEERGLDTTQAGNYMRALRAHRAGDKPTLKYELRHAYVWRSELFPVLYEMAQRLPKTALESIRTEAYKQLDTQLDPKALRVCGYKDKKAKPRKIKLEVPF
jgi:DNA invertase Pin-like site-specific DNA recombinase